MAIFRFFHSPKASESGRFDILPSSTIRTNSGDSLSLSRIQSETIDRIADSKNGIRHPHVLNASSPIQVRVPITTSNAANSPNVAVV